MSGKIRLVRKQHSNDSGVAGQMKGGKIVNCSGVYVGTTREKELDCRQLPPKSCDVQSRVPVFVDGGDATRVLGQQFLDFFQIAFGGGNVNIIRGGQPWHNCEEKE